MTQVLRLVASCDARAETVDCVSGSSRSAALPSRPPGAWMTASPVPADRAVRFLFVDDDAAILRALKEICGTERDFTAETAEDAVSALALIAVRPPNVVVADQWMPGMDGVELLSQLRVTR